MSATIALIAPGAMGSAVGKQLTDHGARVLTLTEGRSEQSRGRAKAAGMIPSKIEEIAAVEIILSIVPPGEAVKLAKSLAAPIRAGKSKPVYIDLNATSPKTMQEVVAALSGCGCEVLDGSIIGPPPVKSADRTTFYVSGDPNKRSDLLAKFGLRLRRIDGPIGAASSLKMVYAGINKGLTALGTAMFLAAERNGCAESLREEMKFSSAPIMMRLAGSIPDMYPKAYRWVAEMNEIAEFLGPGDPAAKIYQAMAKVYAEMAQDRKADGKRAKSLDGILTAKKK
jgi:3-hydroxyisobutyrate dehydrogenase-like beta-hydroxyacid dehydrogenase